MKAIILNNKIIICPSCSRYEFTVYRREASHGIVKKHCRCKHCGETFTYREDRTGTLLLD